MGTLTPSKTKMFKRVLVANRGEIACRIIKTCQRLSIETVAVGSTIDKASLHMKMANKAIVIGKEQAQESYLNADAILEAALKSEAEAIHPGYGFLSENPDFAQSVRDRGLIFIGPSTKVIREMGCKSEAKAIAQSVSVPIIPGFEGDGDLKVEAKRLGFPLLIKATYGGGGKGMRRVNAPQEFEEALTACQREAMAAFGNDQVMLEKYLECPRHVEVQILGDQHGNCIVLSDRDCSLQRRHQKVIEEAPAPFIASQLRNKLHEAAVAIGKAVSYEGVGTVEFLVTQTEEFFFLEMNTRLQVEHPVTEMVLGLDLVEWQLRVAAGEHIHLAQKDCVPNGHAIEARLYAEDGENHFLPSIGTITKLDLPEGKNLRVDTGIREGDAVTIYYDPMIAKITAWGKSREDALKELIEALSPMDIKGIKTNIRFLERLLSHPSVLKGPPDIGFIDRFVDHSAHAPKEAYLLAAIWLRHQISLISEDPPWSTKAGWRLNGPAISYYSFVNGGEVSLATTPTRREISFGGCSYLVGDVNIGQENKITAIIDGEAFQGQLRTHKDDIYIDLNGSEYRLRQSMVNAQDQKISGPAHLMSPMPGRVISVLVAMGEAVVVGQPLLILEAMKMEHTIRAPHAGVVDYLPFASGDFCEEGVELARLKVA